MTKKNRTKTLRQLRSEIIEMAGDLHAVGITSDGNFEKITMRMLDKDKLPKVEPLSARRAAAPSKVGWVSEDPTPPHDSPRVESSPSLRWGRPRTYVRSSPRR
jgi:hypothetical protein